MTVPSCNSERRRRLAQRLVDSAVALLGYCLPDCQTCGADRVPSSTVSPTEFESRVAITSISLTFSPLCVYYLSLCICWRSRQPARSKFAMRSGRPGVVVVKKPAQVHSRWRVGPAMHARRCREHQPAAHCHYVAGSRAGPSRRARDYALWSVSLAQRQVSPSASCPVRRLAPSFLLLSSFQRKDDQDRD